MLSHSVRDIKVLKIIRGASRGEGNKISLPCLSWMCEVKPMMLG